MSWTEASHWPAKECYPTTTTDAHPASTQANELANTMQPFTFLPAVAAPSHTAHQMAAVQMAPNQVLQAPLIVCHALAPQHDQALAWPACQYVANDHCEDRDKLGLSSSARRRLRRKHAAERRSEAQAPPGEQSHGSDTSEDSTELIKCTELVEAIEAGGEARTAALGRLRGSMVQLTFDREGCRLVQAAIQVADRAVVAELLAELHGHVRAALASPHANYVIQTVITALPTTMSSFIAKELLGVAASTAQHRFGCRIFCRLIEHCGASADVAELLQEVLAEVEDLCSHAFGHYVIESLLEHLPEHRERIVQALRADLLCHACHRCGCHVVESALLHGSEVDRQGLILDLLGGDTVTSLAQQQYGSVVLKVLLNTPGDASKEAWGRLLQATSLLQGTRYGRHLMQELGISTEVAP